MDSSITTWSRAEYLTLGLILLSWTLSLSKGQKLEEQNLKTIRPSFPLCQIESFETISAYIFLFATITIIQLNWSIFVSNAILNIVPTKKGQNISRRQNKKLFEIAAPTKKCWLFQPYVILRRKKSSPSVEKSNGRPILVFFIGQARWE